MAGSRVFVVPVLIALALSGGCRQREATATNAGGRATGSDVTANRIVDADREPGNWSTHGRTYSEQRFSPFRQIDDKNANQLGLAWHYDLDTNRGQEATPLVVDGVMYFTTAWSKVVALNAAT